MPTIPPPTEADLADWRRQLAAPGRMISAPWEYAPEEFDRLIDAYEEQARRLAAAEADRERLLAALKRLRGWSHCIQSPDPYEELDADIAAADAAIAGR